MSDRNSSDCIPEIIYLSKRYTEPVAWTIVQSFTLLLPQPWMNGNAYTLVYCGSRKEENIPFCPNIHLSDEENDCEDIILSDEEEMIISSAILTIHKRRYSTPEEEAMHFVSPSRATLYWDVVKVTDSKLFQFVYFWILDGKPQPTIDRVRATFDHFSRMVYQDSILREATPPGFATVYVGRPIEEYLPTV